MNPNNDQQESRFTLPLSFLTNMTENDSLPPINFPSSDIPPPSDLLHLLFPQFISNLSENSNRTQLSSNNSSTSVSTLIPSSSVNQNTSNNVSQPNTTNSRPPVTERPANTYNRRSERQTVQPENENMKYCENRLGTFVNWPEDYHVKAYDLARAGFYYTGTTDMVKCHCCNITISNWKKNDDPISEHLRWNSQCDFMKMIYCHDSTKLKHSYTDTSTNASLLRLLEHSIDSI